MERYLCMLSLLALGNAVVFPKEFETKLQSFIEASMKCHHIPGMTLSIVQGKESYYAFHLILTVFTLSIGCLLSYMS